VKGRRQRRVKVVDGRLQYGMIAVFLSVIVAGLLVFTAVAALVIFLAGEGNGGGGASLVTSILPWLLLNDLALMVLVIVVGIFATHRIAGPIYRMESDIVRVLGGERGVSVRLRRTDAFPGLARRVNELIEHLERSRAS
jgi:methyl-accepting chemotaxis protein